MQEGTDMEQLLLMEMAREVQERAYAPYSGFRVGAALQGVSGKVYTGCNVENASYGLTICAERTAVVKAVSEGEQEFKALALVGDGEGITFPCGACLQVLAEFAPNLVIVLSDGQGHLATFSLKDLLPHTFVLDNREEDNGD